MVLYKGATPKQHPKKTQKLNQFSNGYFSKSFLDRALKMKTEIHPITCYSSCKYEGCHPNRKGENPKKPKN